jgi:hypothetical protein
MPITTTPSGGPQGEFSTYTPIYAQTLSATTASITFSNIPTTFTDLILIVNAASETTHAFLNMQFNGDTGSNYSYTELLGNGTNATSTRYSNSTQVFNANVAMQQTTISFNGIYQIMNYSNATTNKSGLARLNCINSDYNGSIAIAGTWRNTSPITSIKVFPSRGGTPYNFSVGSTFTLYGIKAAAPAPKATGGDMVYTDNTYWYHVFKNSGVFDVKTSINADYLVVAGGGGGGGIASNGGAGAGGGGAGGFRTSIGGSALSLVPSGYTVVIGAGGVGGVGNGASTNGFDSVFSTITSTGGGLGAHSRNGGSGGSGGGARYDGTIGSGNTPSTSPSQGNSGGLGTSGNQPNAGGGGGGASAVGGNAGSSTGGNGGNGTSSSISGSSVTYAGGGGGGVYTGGGGTPGTGGTGGGGAGNYGGNGTSGTANTGGGGGGTGLGTAGSYNGGSGGSGIVIVRYAV